MGGLALFAALTLLAALAPAGALAATGSISGTVTDASTTGGIQGIEVCAYLLESEEEFEEPNWTCADTGSAGTFAIEGLEPGEYKVEFWPGPLGYFFQYYDAKSAWSEADRVPVGTGAVTGIDAEMVASGRLEGTVVEAIGEAPVAEVEVCAWRVDTESEEFGGCRYTGTDGTYSISSLPAGTYKVEFWPEDPSLVRQFYDERDSWSEADTVEVTLGETQSEIDARLDPAAEIKGSVSSASTGTPLREVVVCSLEALSGEFARCGETDFGGHYRLGGLLPGSYKVAFSLEFKEFFGEEFFEGEDDGYLTQFYNGKPTLAAADTLSLAAGGTSTGIDAHLLRPAIPVPLPPVVVPVPPKKRGIQKPKSCKKGTKRKKVHGKVRCVRIRRHNHRHRHGHKHRLDRLESRSPELLRLFSR
jgi:hypothetical protein